MEKTELFNIEISAVAETSLVTLYCHALESQTKEPVLKDPKSLEIVQELNSKLAKSKNKLHRKMARGKLDRKLIVHISLRAKRYDEYIMDFLKSSPNGIVVNIGCGLDTRFDRIDNGTVIFYDLDFPEVIKIKKKFFSENNRYHFIPSSVLNFEWMRPLLKLDSRSFLFVAEGVLMYLHKEEVKSLILKLQSNFPSSYFVCEVFNELWLNKTLKWLVNFKLHHELHLGKGVTYNFGIRDSNEMEEWNPGIQFLEDWSYFDEKEKKLGWLKFFRNIDLFRKTQWTVYYKLN